MSWSARVGVAPRVYAAAATSSSARAAGSHPVPAVRRRSRHAGGNVHQPVKVFQMQIGPGVFTGLTYDLVLPVASLNANYVAMVIGQNATTGSDQSPNEACARVIGDPHGSGTLAIVAANTLRLGRTVADGEWVGTVIVIEDALAKMFQLLDVIEPVMAATTSAGPQSATPALATGSWTDSSEVWACGGMNGGGVETAAGSSDQWNAAAWTVEPTGTNQVAISRDGEAGALNANATATIYVAQFSPGWQTEHYSISSAAGARGLGAGSHQVATAAPVWEPEHTFVWGCAASKGRRPANQSWSFTLGDGDGAPVADPTGDVSAGQARANDATVDAWSAKLFAFSHPQMRVQRFKVDQASSRIYALNEPRYPEAYTSGSTDGSRFGVAYLCSDHDDQFHTWDLRAWVRPISTTLAQLTTIGKPSDGHVQVVDLGRV